MQHVGSQTELSNFAISFFLPSPFSSPSSSCPSASPPPSPLHSPPSPCPSSPPHWRLELLLNQAQQAIYKICNVRNFQLYEKKLICVMVMLILRPNLRPAKKTMMLMMRMLMMTMMVMMMLMMLMLRRNLRPAKKATMLRPLHTPVNVITLPLILGKKIPARITNCKSLPFFYFNQYCPMLTQYHQDIFHLLHKKFFPKYCLRIRTSIRYLRCLLGLVLLGVEIVKIKI